MPSEPQQNIEEELKAYAKERRERADALSEMPLAMRKRLQGEVDRAFVKPRFKTRWEMFQSLWPRLAFAGIIAVVFVGILYWQGYFHAAKTMVVAGNNQQDRARGNIEKVPFQQTDTGEKKRFESKQSDEPQRLLTKNSATIATKVLESAPASESRKGYGSAPVPAAASVGKDIGAVDQNMEAPQKEKSEVAQLAGESSKEAVGKTHPITLDGHIHAEPVPMVSAAPVPETGGKPAHETMALAKKKVMETSNAQGVRSKGQMDSVPAIDQKTVASLVQSQNAAPVVKDLGMLINQTSNAQKLSNNYWTQMSQKELNLHFVCIDNRNQYRANLLSPALPRVMVSFVMERHGNLIRVSDEDGSVYEGKIVDQTDASRNQAQNLANMKMVTGNQGVAFRVSGLNKTRKQQIVFDGTLTWETVANLALARNQLPARNAAANLQNAQNSINIKNETSQINFLDNVTFWINGRMKVGENIEFVMDARSLH